MDFTKKDQIMGIVNVTPDSFSDGGKYSDVAAAIAHGKQLVADGADILDIGGQSTRPGYQEVSPEIELARIIPVIEGLKSLAVPISVDTYFPEVAKGAIQAGASIINDIKGLDTPDMAETLAKYPEVKIIIMHSRKRNSQSLAVGLADFYAEKIALCEKVGISLANICFDPGVGFGKSAAENIELVRYPEKYRFENYPILYGISRKRTIGHLTGEEQADQRDFGSVTASLFLLNQGIEIVRVHNVFGMKQALKTWRSLVD
ncbi:dihydropteroate synthase [Enterococcus alishanensis]|nr:dihydropteroate synthase [Enterococcus alishanensis]